MDLNIFNGLDKYSSKIAVITEHSKEISYYDLLSEANNLIKKIDKRCLVFALCRNTFEFLLGYVGFMKAGAAVFLISDSIHIDNLKYLLEKYKPNFVYIPSKK